MQTRLETQSLAGLRLPDLTRAMLVRLGGSPECDGQRDTAGRMEWSMQHPAIKGLLTRFGVRNLKTDLLANLL
jgi:hypothetical protein